MHIAAWLADLGLERYEPAFRENEIDLDVLPSLTAEDLKDLGIVIIGHRRASRTSSLAWPPAAFRSSGACPTRGASSPEIRFPSRASRFGSLQIHGSASYGALAGALAGAGCAFEAGSRGFETGGAFVVGPRFRAAPPKITLSPARIP